jgi:putative transposase
MRAEAREVVRMLSQPDPIRQRCHGLKGPRRRHDDRAQRRDETSLTTAIERLAGAWPRDGYRRLTARLHREPVQVNRQHVARRMREMGLPGQRPVRHPRTTHSTHASPRSRHLVREVTIVRPDQVWVSAITDSRVREALVYLAVLMDVSTRCSRGWHLSRHLDPGLTFTAWRRALVRQQPDMHHSDQGVPYAATADVQTLHARGVQSSRATGGAATEHGSAERLRRTSTAEEVRLHDDADFHEAYPSSGRFLDDVYQQKRIHSAFGYLTPAAFETHWLQQAPPAVSGA